MNTIEIYLNIIHFCFYRVDYKIHLISNRMNPFNLIHKLPFQKRRYEKLGIKPIETINKFYGNKRNGTAVIFAGGFLWIFVALIVFFLLIKSGFFVDETMSLSLTCTIISASLCYWFVFKNGKYLTYFEKFEKWTESEKQRYYLLTLISTIGGVFLFYLSLIH